MYFSYATPSIVTTRCNEQLEIIRLRYELNKARDEIQNLNNQLVDNVETMCKFEKSIQKMRSKMAQITCNVEEKENEISKLYTIIDKMKRNSTNDLDKKTCLKVDPHHHHHSGWFKDQVSKVLKRKSKKDYLPLIDNVSDYKNCVKQKTIDCEIKPERVCISAPSTPKFMMKNQINLADFSDNINVLQRKLSEKDRLITEMKLELLSSENQMIDLLDTKNPLEKQLSSLKEENKRLESLTHKHLTDNNLQQSSSPASSSSSINEMKESLYGYSKKILLILDGWNLSCFSILTTTNWSQLDDLVKIKFKEYLQLMDDKSNLGLSTNDLKSYQVGKEKIERKFVDEERKKKDEDDASLSSSSSPEMLPYGYLVEDNSVILKLKTLLDYLVFETSISKIVLSKIILLAQKEAKLLFVAQNGTGKSFLVKKLANYLVKLSRKKCAHTNCQDEDEKMLAVKGSDYVYFVNFETNIDDDTVKPIMDDLSVKCQKDNNLVVLILKNVHILPKLEQFFKFFNQSKIYKLPIILATGISSGINLHYLELRHGFKTIDWCKSFGQSVSVLIKRFLTRKMLAEKARLIHKSLREADWDEVIKTIDWISQVWERLNSTINLKQRKDETMSMEPFMEFPVVDGESQIWFLNLWNLIIVPFLRKNMRQQNSVEKIIVFNRWINQTYPWTTGKECLLSALSDKKNILERADQLIAI